MLFDFDVERSEGSGLAQESNYEYLRRSNRPQAIEICHWMNEWFREFPPDAMRQMKSRLKARNGGTFNGARFELLVHRMLKRLGLIVEVERELSTTEKRVDFFVLPPSGSNGSAVYIEATVSGFGQGQLSSNWNEYDAVEKIRRYISYPHSDIWLEAEGTLRRTLGKSEIVCCFEQLLERYRPEEVQHLYSTSQRWKFPFCEVADGNWTLTGYLHPPRSSSGVGQVFGPARSSTCDGSKAIRDSVFRKASAWKNVNLEGIPLLVAVNCCQSEFFWSEHDNIDIQHALFANSGGDGCTGEFQESLNCLCGVIVFYHAVLGNERRSRVQMFGNENADLPEYLHFLFDPHELGALLGIERARGQ